MTLKKTKKVISYLLFICMFMSSLPLNAFASTQNSTETFTSVELGVILEKVITNDKITVYTKSLDGKLLHTGTNDNGQIFFDGKYMPEWSDSKNSFATESTKMNLKGISTTSSDWSNWSYDTDTIQTGGLSTAAIAGLIALKAGWTPLGVAAVIAAAVAGKYDTIRIDWQTRYKADSKFQYVERNTTFYGDGKFISVPGNPVHENIKRPIDK